MREGIAKEALFERLAAGHAAGVTVVTPNRRLAAALTADFDACQATRGASVWEAADVLPFGAFVERLWEDALYSALGGALPVLLTPAQEQHVWEAILADSGLLVVPQAAAQCRDAWLLAHAWRIRPQGGSDDAAAFAEWVRRYQQRTAGHLDAARLPDRVAALLPEKALRKPRLLVAYAFDILPPQTAAFFEAVAALGAEVRRCEPARREARTLRVAFASGKDELEAAARWARERLEAGSKRIAIVVPDLAGLRKQVVRVFSRVMAPAFNLPGAPRAAMPFNVSLGERLAAAPLIAAALLLLEACVREIPFARASALIRCPFIAGAESEMAARARLDARLRLELSASVALARLVSGAIDCPQLRRALEALLGCARERFSGEHSLHEWARHFALALQAAGFPGERALDSDEYQTCAKWQETLGELARLGRIFPAVSAARALALLSRLCDDTLFQPHSGEAPIQVLGVLESAGLEFEHLWVSGLTDEAWPLDARPNPFLPVRAQKEAGIPQASAESSLLLDRRITAQWLSAAGEVVLSHPLKEADRELSPSPLISDIPLGEIALPTFPRYRDQIFTARGLVPESEGAPPYGATVVRGGTRVLADQAACPFRAFARHRLAAEALEAPGEAPDAADRGVLLHELMRQLWTSLRSSGALGADVTAEIARAAARAVDTVGLEGRFAALEHERLERLAREWLALERERPPFEVVALEERRVLGAGGLEFSGRIDRMDRLADGSCALIDYKSASRLTPRQWMEARPDDPQLPLYAVSANEDIAAVAFARVRAGEMRFMGYARDDGALPGLTRYDSWDTLLGGWKDELERLARAFAEGDARVDPKRGLQSCRLCDLQPLCRVHERLNALEEPQASE